MPRVKKQPTTPVPETENPEVATKPSTPTGEKNGKPAGASRLATSSKRSKSSTKAVEDRPVVYEKVKMSLCMGDSALTAAQAKKIMGWQEESENIKFGADFLLTDTRGVKIRCYNDVKNRPLYRSVVDTLQQEILRRRWNFNGEPIIIGKTALVLNGQHQLCALILADQVREDKPGQYSGVWPTAPTIDKAIVFGVDESDSVVNTMDTCKPRTLADVIYRSEYFANIPPKDRKIVARYTDYAVRLLWHRTGAANAFAPRRTHAESLDFIARHPRLLEAVKHIHEENGENKIGQYLSPGYAAGLLYLQASALTDRNNDEKTGYSDVSTPNETQLDLSLWDKACEFWVNLAANHASVAAVRHSLAAVYGEEGTGTFAEKIGIVVKAWNLWTANKKVTAESLALSYTEDGEGTRKLDETPTVGGIDLGAPPPV